jgi:hypothetical protein
MTRYLDLLPPRVRVKSVRSVISHPRAPLNTLNTLNTRTQEAREPPFGPDLSALNALNAHAHEENETRRCGNLEEVLAALEARVPDRVDRADWELAVAGARRFLAVWGEQARSLGWSVRDLFGLHEVPAVPSPTYRRLSRYDETGLVWLLRGCEVVALTETTAAIRNPSGSILSYRRFNKPAFGPVGDSLDDFPPSAA